VPIFQMSCDLRNRCFLNMSLTIAVALRVQSVCGEGVAMVGVVVRASSWGKAVWGGRGAAHSG
jgi:hypothetical protein